MLAEGCIGMKGKFFAGTGKELYKMEKNESLKNLFPQTPEAVRSVVQEKVTEMSRIESEKTRTVRLFRLAKAACIAFLCFASIGVTAFAAGKLMDLYAERMNGSDVKTELIGEVAVDGEVQTYTFACEAIPEGMQWEEVGISWKILLKDKAISGREIANLWFSEAEPGDKWLDTRIEDYEESLIGGHTVVCLETEDRIYENVVIKRDTYYVLFEEEQLIMTLCSFDILSKEEISRIIENIRLEPTEDENAENLILLCPLPVGEFEL